MAATASTSTSARARSPPDVNAGEERGRAAQPPVLRLGQHGARAWRRAPWTRRSQRVDNYAAGFIKAGAAAVIAEAYASPNHMIKAVLGGGRSIESAWRGAPSKNGHALRVQERAQRGLRRPDGSGARHLRVRPVDRAQGWARLGGRACAMREARPPPARRRCRVAGAEPRGCGHHGEAADLRLDGRRHDAEVRACRTRSAIARPCRRSSWPASAGMRSTRSRSIRRPRCAEEPAAAEAGRQRDPAASADPAAER